jgi:hypothetical protein
LAVLIIAVPPGSAPDAIGLIRDHGKVEDARLSILQFFADARPIDVMASAAERRP